MDTDADRIAALEAEVARLARIVAAHERAGKIRRGLRELDELQALDELESRLCACGCGQPVTSPRPEARYATPACRVRAHRAR